MRPEYAEAALAGHLEYECEQQDLNPAGHARTPRDAAVEDITQRLSSLTTTTNEAHCMNRNFLYAYTVHLKLPNFLFALLTFHFHSELEA